MKNPIPAAAIRVNFVCNGKLVKYSVWERRGWNWVAVGNSGVEKSKEAAMEAARRWIRDSQ